MRSKTQAGTSGDRQSKKGGRSTPFFFARLTRSDRVGRHMDQRAGIPVFQHPQRAIGALFHVADSVSHIPALGGLGAAMAVKDDPVE